MNVAVETLGVYLQLIRDWKDTIIFYIAPSKLTIVSLLVRVDSGASLYYHRIKRSLFSVFSWVG